MINAPPAAHSRRRKHVLKAVLHSLAVTWRGAVSRVPRIHPCDHGAHDRVLRLHRQPRAIGRHRRREPHLHHPLGLKRRFPIAMHGEEIGVEASGSGGLRRPRVTCTRGIQRAASAAVCFTSRQAGHRFDRSIQNLCAHHTAHLPTNSCPRSWAYRAACMAVRDPHRHSSPAGSGATHPARESPSCRGQG